MAVAAAGVRDHPGRRGISAIPQVPAFQEAADSAVGTIPELQAEESIWIGEQGIGMIHRVALGRPFQVGAGVEPAVLEQHLGAEEVLGDPGQGVVAEGWVVREDEAAPVVDLADDDTRAAAAPAPFEADLGARAILLAAMAAYGVGRWLGTIPTIIRLVTSRERLAHKVKLRAEQAFYRHGLHATKGRTGILILVSLMERRVHVLADKGINDLVPPGTWDGLVSGIIDGIRTGKQTDAICEAITKCGALLAQVSPAGSGENPDELPDELIQEP